MASMDGLASARGREGGRERGEERDAYEDGGESQRRVFQFFRRIGKRHGERRDTDTAAVCDDIKGGDGGGRREE